MLVRSLPLTEWMMSPFFTPICSKGEPFRIPDRR
jgi:hypothetical protein